MCSPFNPTNPHGCRLCANSPYDRHSNCVSLHTARSKRVSTSQTRMQIVQLLIINDFRSKRNYFASIKSVMVTLARSMLTKTIGILIQRRQVARSAQWITHSSHFNGHHWLSLPLFLLVWCCVSVCMSVYLSVRLFKTLPRFPTRAQLMNADQ